MKIDKKTIIIDRRFFTNVKKITNFSGSMELLEAIRDDGQKVIINPKEANIKEVFIIDKEDIKLISI